MDSENKLHEQSSETLNNLVGLAGSGELNDNLKEKVISTITQVQLNQEENRTGRLGKIFGNRRENISLYIAFIICIALIIVGLIYILLPTCYKHNTNIEFWQLIGPIITGALGFIFGADSNSK